MKTLINSFDLPAVLMRHVPEAEKEFSTLGRGASIYSTLHKLYEVTSILAHQNRFKAVKHCLLAAEDILLHAEPSLSSAVSTIYVYQLSRLLARRDARADVVRYLLPPALRAEYRRQVNSCLP